MKDVSCVMENEKCPKCNISLNKDKDSQSLAIKWLFGEANLEFNKYKDNCDLCGFTFKERVLDNI